MDFFDTDDKDRLVEHWDVLAKYADSTPSGHNSVDGPSEVVDLEKTEENEALVRRLMEGALMKSGDPKVILELVHEDYIQHNKEVPDGRAPFLALASDPNRPLWYQEIFMLVGSGNFVAALSKATWEGEDYAQADLFRVEDGLVVEHWDAAEKIKPKEEWVNSGKF